VARKPILQTLLNLIAVSAVFLAAGWLSRRFAASGGPAGAALDAVVWSAALLAAMPFLIAAWRKIRAISLILAEGALAGRDLPEARALALRNLLANTGSLLAGAILAAWLLAASSTFLPSVPALLGAGIFIAALTAALYRWMVRFQATLQAGLSRLADSSPDHGAEEKPPPLDLIRRYYPYGVGAAEVVIAEGGASAGRSLRDLSLRSVTGATVVAVERGGARQAEIVALPLAAGDRLFIVGEEDQIRRARRILEGGAESG
jgi:hypothetical protein